MAALVHLVTHAEAENPSHLVSGSAPGFGLSARGMEQARRVGRYLAPRPVVAIWSSPAERALRTAEEIASRSGVPVRVEPGLSGWSIEQRWQGHPWHEINTLFAGEFDEYLNHPEAVAFAGETLAELADRVSSVAKRLDVAHPHGDVAIVSHQDSIQAARLRLLGSDIGALHRDKPGTGAVVSLRPGTTWRQETVWEPGSSTQFGEKADLRPVPSVLTPVDPNPA